MKEALVFFTAVEAKFLTAMLATHELCVTKETARLCKGIRTKIEKAQEAKPRKGPSW